MLCQVRERQKLNRGECGAPVGGAVANNLQVLRAVLLQVCYNLTIPFFLYTALLYMAFTIDVKSLVLEVLCICNLFAYGLELFFCVTGKVNSCCKNAKAVPHVMFLKDRFDSIETSLHYAGPLTLPGLSDGSWRAFYSSDFMISCFKRVFQCEGNNLHMDISCFALVCAVFIKK